MHMTLEADYAVRIVEFLAVNPGRADAKTISERTSVTLRFTLKILRTLVSDGIVRSYKGAKGGYELAKPPKGDHAAQRDRGGGGAVYDFPLPGRGVQLPRTSCRLHHIYGEVSQLVRDKLESYTFASICACEDTEADEKGRGKRQKRKRIHVKVQASTYLKRNHSF